MMKATGIVRRIDDLGRIVIPKEIRRTLHIRESDPLEIFTDREGQVILKKYSPIGEMTTFAKQYAESLAQVSGHATLIADRDQFIAVSGGCKQLLNKSVSRQLEEKVKRDCDCRKRRPQLCQHCGRHCRGLCLAADHADHLRRGHHRKCDPVGK